MSQPRSTTPKHAHPGILLRRTSVLNVWIAIVPVKYAPPVSPICERIPAHHHENLIFPPCTFLDGHTLCVAQSSCARVRPEPLPAYPASKNVHAPSVTAFAPAQCESTIMETLLNALQSISDAMYAPSCVWKNAREWCWFPRWRLTKAMIGSHE